MKTPMVVTWYKVYCGAMVLMYVLCAIFGVVALFIDPSLLDTKAGDMTELRIQGAIFLVVGVPLAILYFVAALLPPRPWSWVVGIVAIAFALSSCCCVPVAVPLLIYWLKPETKAYFGRS